MTSGLEDDDNTLLSPHRFCANDMKTVFGFGDSFTNLMGPKGDVWTWNHFQSNDSVLDAPIRINGTTAHGPNWIEYLTECYEGLPQDCDPELFDVAYGGASVDSDLVPPPYTHIVDFIHQVKQWKKYLEPAVSWNPESTLTAVWFGINDALTSSKTKTWIELGILFNKIMDAYNEQLETLYSYGMRSFLVVNVPPMEHAPAHIGNNTIAKVVKSFNDLLQARVALFNIKHKDDVFIHYFDAHRYFNEYLTNSSGLFKNTTGYCSTDKCEYPNYEYFWMNNIHPMYPVHKLLAEDLSRELKEASQCSS
ncbi:hypothetical protein K492DRAFT_184281 [Lichtheimia hyalospora FSU 10163]|nr:hypothetical protein K492DRAFT_184281 [Lichtheimia hyalospora FSU 10163]